MCIFTEMFVSCRAAAESRDCLSAVNSSCSVSLCPADSEQHVTLNSAPYLHHVSAGTQSTVYIPQTHLVWVVGSSIFPAAAAVTVLHATFGRFSRFLFTHRKKVEATFDKQKAAVVSSTIKSIIQVTDYFHPLDPSSSHTEQHSVKMLGTSLNRTAESFHMLTLSVLSWSPDGGQYWVRLMDRRQTSTDVRSGRSKHASFWH